MKLSYLGLAQVSASEDNIKLYQNVERNVGTSFKQGVLTEWEGLVLLTS
jgi:hypothetical protein